MNSHVHSNTQIRPRPAWLLVAMLGGALALTACSKTQDETMPPPPPADGTTPPASDQTPPPPGDSGSGGTTPPAK